ncbi:hypothetical protein BGY98DRAFT_204725 [Russula aff. rugulosa BPL654]|nr:hypothetical protein BGY98DRAFT_204725 [Russula aff. rugulosa BPL654]
MGPDSGTMKSGRDETPLQWNRSRGRAHRSLTSQRTPRARRPPARTASTTRATLHHELVPGHHIVPLHWSSASLTSITRGWSSTCLRCGVELGQSRRGFDELEHARGPSGGGPTGKPNAARSSYSRGMSVRENVKNVRLGHKRGSRRDGNSLCD